MRLLLPEPRSLVDADLLDLYGVDAPRLRAGFVLSVDGGAAQDGSSRPLQTPADAVALRSLRAVSDAVLVGAGTARSEDYGPVRLRAVAADWRRAHGRAPRPPLVVVSRALDLRPTDRCLSAPALVVTCASADQRRRSALAEVAEVVVAGDDEVDLPAALDALAERGLVRVLCEGGPALLTALVRAGRVDELCLTVSPRLLGTAPTLLTQALPEPVDLRLQHLVGGDDGSLLVRYAVERPD